MIDFSKLIRQVQQITVAFWHQASDDDWGTMPEHWALFTVIEPANVKDMKVYVFRRISDLWNGDHGGEVAVHVRFRDIDGDQEYHIEYAGWRNSCRPTGPGIHPGCTYNDGARLEWRYGDPRTHYYDNEVGHRVVGGAWDQKAEQPPRPKNFGEWS